MLSSAMEGQIDYETLQKRGARLSTPNIFRSAFKNFDRKGEFKISASIKDFAYSMSINSVDEFSFLAESLKERSRPLAGRSNNGARINGIPLPHKLDNKKGIFPLLEAFLNISREEQPSLANAVADLEDLTRYAIFAPATPLLRGVEPDTSAKEPLGLYGGRLAEALSEVISDNVDADHNIRRFFKMMDWVKSFGVANKDDPDLVSGHRASPRAKVRYEDKFMKANFNSLYAYDVSEGALYVLFVLLLLVHKNAPNIFALDNVDSALNPGLVRGLMAEMVAILRQDPRKQVFLTTHNATALDAIDLFDPTHRLFVIERDQNGHTKSRRIQPPAGISREQWAEMHGGLSLSDVWLAGAIGGLPAGY